MKMKLNNLKYLSDSESFPIKERNAFLKNMKEQDIKDNQITENENETLKLRMKIEI